MKIISELLLWFRTGVALLLAFCAGLQFAYLWPNKDAYFISRGWLIFDIVWALTLMVFIRISLRG